MATELNDLMQDRFATFLYSKRQEVVAGTDGEETFSRVFGSESRIVVVLYRQGWGKSPWTRIEETAIRNRGFEEGYDFLVLIPIEQPASAPRWLPKSQIWVGYERWGVEGAAAVIESRIQGAGGSPRIESVEDQAARLQRKIENEAERKRFLNSEQGVAAAKNESNQLFSVLEEKVASIVQRADFRLAVERLRDGVDVCASYGCLSIDWNTRYTNSLDESGLEMILWGGKPPRPGRMHFNKPSRLRAQHYCFDRLATGEFGWREANEGAFLSTDNIADTWLSILMGHAHDEHIKRGR